MQKSINKSKDQKSINKTIRSKIDLLRYKLFSQKTIILKIDYSNYQL